MMSASVILSPLVSLFYQYWYIVAFALVIQFFRIPTIKGFLGEVFLNIIITIRLSRKKYRLIKNVTLPTEDGTTQIDHIIVSEFGIFVIETKNMRGWIFGNEKQKIWTQKIYKHTSKFQNPLHQNYKHTKTLESILSIDSENIFSVVVFVGDSTFKTDMPRNVTSPNGLIRFIRSKTKKVLSPAKVQIVISLIESGRLSKTFKTHKGHVEHIQNLIQAKENLCPKCQSKLVLRVAKQGVNIGNTFYGCSSYPKCNYTTSFS